MTPTFERPTGIERAFSRLFGILVGLGIGLPHNDYFPDLHGELLARKPSADAHYELAHAR